MNGLVTTIIAFIIALGVLITVHEFGHFWVARRLGVKVLRFSIGFGAPVWLKRGKDGVEYVVAALPLGGYVRMLDEREEDVPEDELPRAFNRQRLSTRTSVVAAGPLANLLFALLAYWAVFMIGDVGMRPLIGDVEANSPAYAAGLRAGDELLAVDDVATPTWERAVYALVEASLDEGDMDIRVRDETGGERTLRASGRLFTPLADGDEGLEAVGLSQLRPRLPPRVGEVISGEPADRAGLEPGDLIVAADGVEVSDWSQWVDLVRASPDESLEVEVERNGERLALSLTPAAHLDGGETVGRIGAAAEIPEGFFDRYQATIRLGPVDAMAAAAGKTWDMTTLTLRAIWGMLSGQLSVNNLGGPITIARSAGQSASIGGVYFLKFLAVLSVSIGVLNLLPVPVLDGGHLMFYFIEAVRGRPLSEQAQMLGQKIGLALLLALMGLALYIDLNRVLVN